MEPNAVTIYRSAAGMRLTAGRSKNLRALVTYARKHGVSQVRGIPDGNGGGLLNVVFDNGAWTDVRFASYTVMQDYVWYRRVRWGICMFKSNEKQVLYKKPETATETKGE